MAFLEEMVIRGNFMDDCFLNNVSRDKKVYAVLAPKKELVCVLPLIGKNYFT